MGEMIIDLPPLTTPTIEMVNDLRDEVNALPDGSDEKTQKSGDLLLMKGNQALNQLALGYSSNAPYEVIEQRSNLVARILADMNGGPFKATHPEQFDAFVATAKCVRTLYPTVIEIKGIHDLAMQRTYNIEPNICSTLHTIQRAAIARADQEERLVVKHIYLDITNRYLVLRRTLEERISNIARSIFNRYSAGPTHEDLQSLDDMMTPIKSVCINAPTSDEATLFKDTLQGFSMEMTVRAYPHNQFSFLFTYRG